MIFYAANGTLLLLRAGAVLSNNVFANVKIFIFDKSFHLNESAIFLTIKIVVCGLWHLTFQKWRMNFYQFIPVGRTKVYLVSYYEFECDAQASQSLAAHCLAHSNSLFFFSSTVSCVFVFCMRSLSAAVV